jgi:hypothetical protein
MVQLVLVLLVEPDAHVRARLSRALADAPAIVWAVDGRERAEHLVRQVTPDLLVCGAGDRELLETMARTDQGVRLALLSEEQAGRPSLAVWTQAQAESELRQAVTELSRG